MRKLIVFHSTIFPKGKKINKSHKDMMTKTSFKNDITIEIKPRHEMVLQDEYSILYRE